MLLKGAERIGKQLDIVKFLRTQMLLDVVIRKQLTPLERSLAKHHYSTFVLDVSQTEQSSSESESLLKKLHSDKQGAQTQAILAQQVRLSQAKLTLPLADDVFKRKRTNRPVPVPAD